MQLFCFTGCDDASEVNLERTIYNKIKLDKYRNLLTDEEKKDLESLGLMNGCHMWGAKPGPQNSKRWEDVKSGDRIIGYRNGFYICYGPILYKIHNKNLAESIWGNNKDGDTWEYINVFGELAYMKIPKERYNDIFKYIEDYNPRGFINVRTDLIEEVEKKYESIDNAISILSNEKIDIIANEVKSEIYKLGEAELESYILNMNEAQFKEYIKSLDSSASIETVKKYVKVRKYNKKLIEKMKKRVEERCQICGVGSEHNVSIVEAHHIQKFSLTQNNEPENILILCPNHHRLIHKTKAIINVEKAEIDYRDGTTETYNKIV